MHVNALYRTSEDGERQQSASKKPFNLMLVGNMHKDLQCPIDPNRHTNSWKEGVRGHYSLCNPAKVSGRERTSIYLHPKGTTDFGKDIRAK